MSETPIQQIQNYLWVAPLSEKSDITAAAKAIAEIINKDLDEFVKNNKVCMKTIVKVKNRIKQ